MGLTARLARHGLDRPRLLLVAAPVATAVRLAVECKARQSGWPLAASAADTDVVVTCGPLDEALEEVADLLVAQAPIPRLRVDLTEADAVEAALEAARDQLVRLDPEVLRERRCQPPMTEGHPGHDMGGHAGHDMGGGMQMADEPATDKPAGHDMGGGMQMANEPATDKPAGHDIGGMQMANEPATDKPAGHDMSGHSGHHMSGMEMPGGIAMADRAPDRDGLMLDVLQVALGPVLPYWPAGLRVRAMVQGDILQDARIECLGVANGESFWEAPWRRAAAGEAVTVEQARRHRAAGALDSLSRLLGVAGFDGPALRCQVLRDGLLRGLSTAEVARGLSSLGRRLRRSWLLRQMTDGLGTLSAAQAARIDSPHAVAAGDVTARWRAWLDAAEADLAVAQQRGAEALVGDGAARLGDPATATAERVLAVLPELLVGLELTSARLVLASLDPDLGQLVRLLVESAHG